jgi:hypothetical protein
MLDPATGDIIFRDGTRLGRTCTLDEFVWTSPLHKIAVRGEGAAGWTSWRFQADLQKGGLFHICLRFKEAPLRWIELSRPWEGAPFVADPKWKALHDGWLSEVLGTATPPAYPWGTVASVADPRSGSCCVLIQYAL